MPRCLNWKNFFVCCKNEKKCCHLAKRNTFYKSEEKRVMDRGKNRQKATQITDRQTEKTEKLARQKSPIYVIVISQRADRHTATAKI